MTGEERSAKFTTMASVITDACIKCKYMDCVEVCPADAFYEGANMLVINPDECFDCGVCAMECPAGAIAFDTELESTPWPQLNATYSKIWPNVTRKVDQKPSDAETFKGLTGKYEAHFSAAPGKGDDPSWPRRSVFGPKCNHCGAETNTVGFWRRLFSLFA
jgi:ferredoxin